MTKYSFNYCPIQWYEDELAKINMTLPEFIDHLGVDGIEQYVYSIDHLERPYAEQTIGVHLNYWPYWMDFWLRKAKRLQRQFRSISERNGYFYDALSRDEWLSVIRKNICTALEAQPEYLVWHVAEANNEEIFTWQFNYSDREVLTAAADVFNAVADEVPDNVTVLFENLWWPGLRLTDVRSVKYFFDRIKSDNVGIMLDTGHLMNNNPRLKNEAEAADYVCSIYGKLGEYGKLIRGVHLNCSLSGEYQRKHRQLPAEMTKEEIWKHIGSIDQHLPFKTAAARQILDCVQPDYVTHELYYDSLEDLAQRLAVQRANCR